MTVYTDYEDADTDERDELRREDAFKRRLAAHRARHPNPQDPDYIGPDDDE